MYATLNDSYEWSQLNSTGGLTNKIKDVLAKGEVVTMDRMTSTMLQFKNRIKSPISTNIINRIQDGELVMMYAPDIKIPVYLPFIITRSGNTNKGIVFLNNLDPSTDDNGNRELFFNARKLKVSLESCFISLCLKEMGNSPKTKSTTLLKSGSKIYASMITECINRKHSIKLDDNVYNSLLYVTGRYFVGTMIGCRDSMDPDVMRNYCLYNCKNADVVGMNRILEQFQESDFDNIATLISKIKDVDEFKKRIGDLNVSNFLESYINMYNASMLLGLEVFDYLLYNIISVIDTTYINNYPILKNIVGDDGRKIYSDLVVAVSNL